MRLIPGASSDCASSRPARAICPFACPSLIAEPILRVRLRSDRKGKAHEAPQKDRQPCAAGIEVPGAGRPHDARHRGQKRASNRHHGPEHATTGQPLSSAPQINRKRPARKRTGRKSGRGVVFLTRGRSFPAHRLREIRHPAGHRVSRKPETAHLFLRLLAPDRALVERVHALGVDGHDQLVNQQTVEG